MHTTIINDCRDANAAGRQVTRAASLIGHPASFIGVTNDFQAAGNLIDTLDAFGENPGVVLVNVAPRDGRGKQWPNGTPFGYFWYKKILVLASVDGLTLSLVKKFKLTESITVLDLPNTLDQMIFGNALLPELKDQITETQFRSYEFLPRVAAYLVQGNSLVGTGLLIEDVPDAPPAIWWIDNFGNCKTTLVFDDIHDEIHLSETFGKLAYFPRLKDVPNNTAGIITGSSGLGKQRFLEIVVQGGSAEKNFNVSTGDEII